MSVTHIQYVFPSFIIIVHISVCKNSYIKIKTPKIADKDVGPLLLPFYIFLFQSCLCSSFICWPTYFIHNLPKCIFNNFLVIPPPSFQVTVCLKRPFIVASIIHYLNTKYNLQSLLLYNIFLVAFVITQSVHICMRLSYYSTLHFVVCVIKNKNCR